MKIGIDIDDVLTNTSEVIKEYLIKYEKSGDGISHFVEVMKGDMPTENIKNFFSEYLIEIIKRLTLKDNSQNVIKRFSNNGNEIIFITSRGDEKCQGSERATIEFLKNNNIKYDKIIFNANNKQKICLDNKIDIMIDDSVKNCEAIEKSRN